MYYPSFQILHVLFLDWSMAKIRPSIDNGCCQKTARYTKLFFISWNNHFLNISVGQNVNVWSYFQISLLLGTVVSVLKVTHWNKVNKRRQEVMNLMTAWWMWWLMKTMTLFQGLHHTKRWKISAKKCSCANLHCIDHAAAFLCITLGLANKVKELRV